MASLLSSPLLSPLLDLLTNCHHCLVLLPHSHHLQFIFLIDIILIFSSLFETVLRGMGG